jgi:hypothetical protein
MKHRMTIVMAIVVVLAVSLGGTAQAVTVQSVNAVAVATTTPPTLISIAGGRVAHSGTFQADIIADSFPNGLAGFQVTVSTVDPQIAVAFQFLVPDYGLTAATSTATSVTMAVVDLKDLVQPGAENVVIGTITFLGRNEGITPIDITVLRMDDQDGSPILTSTAVGLLTVSNSRDLDGDGITEDINGNGFFDFADVLELFRMLLALPP